jgi:hypothetical protein
MWPYWMLFLVSASVALVRMRPLRAVDGLAVSRRIGLWAPVWLGLTLMIGLRHEVGGDWFTYADNVARMTGDTLSDAMRTGDPAFQFLNWLGANGWGGEYFINFVCAALFSWGLAVFCRAQPRPWLALVVAVPYLIVVVAMGYTREGVAIGFEMLGLTALMQGSVRRFVFWVIVGATFHKSAVLLIPLAVFSGGKHRVLTVLGVLFTAALTYVFLLQEAVDSLVQNYIDQQYDSSGALVRVAMNALPALLFLIYRKRFRLTPAQLGFWTWMALAAVGFLVLLKLSPSSTAIDRVALYWIPLQLFVWSRVPDVLGRRGQRNGVWVAAIVAYSAVVLFVWLVFGTFSSHWLPYQFYPLVWLGR